MTVIARFEIIPVREGSMSTAIASALRALDDFPVSYRTTPTDTVIEADSVDQIFEAVKAAHSAIPDDRVITSLEIDEDRRRPQNMEGRVASVESKLGHPAERGRPGAELGRTAAQVGPGASPQAGSAATQQPGASAPSQASGSVAPQTGTSVTPQTGADVAPQTGPAVTPQTGGGSMQSPPPTAGQTQPGTVRSGRGMRPTTR